MNISHNQKFDTSATIQCLVALIMWSIGPIFIKLLTAYVDCWTQNLLRYSAACLFWLPFLIFSITRKRLDNRVWKRAIWPSLANIIMQSFWAAAFYYINPAFLHLLSKTYIIWIAGFSLIFFAHERALLKSPHFWLGLTLSLLGVAGVLFSKQDFAAKATVTGIVLTLAGAVMWGLYAVLAKIAFRDIDSRTGFSVICIYTTIGLFLLAIKFGQPHQALEISAKPWAYIIISGIIAIAFSHVLYYNAIKRIGVTIPSLVTLVTPFTVLMLSYIVFGETLNTTQWIFGMVLLIGAALAVWSQQHLVPGNQKDTKA